MNDKLLDVRIARYNRQVCRRSGRRVSVYGLALPDRWVVSLRAKPLRGSERRWFCGKGRA